MKTIETEKFKIHQTAMISRTDFVLQDFNIKMLSRIALILNVHKKQEAMMIIMEEAQAIAICAKCILHTRGFFY